MKDKVIESLISIEHTRTTSMLADPLTNKLTYLCVSRTRHPHGIVKSLESLF